MDFETFLHEAACDATHFAAPHSYEIIEQCATNAYEPARRRLLKHSEIETWASRVITEPREDSLSLLVHQWDPGVIRDGQSIFNANSNLVFPFRDEAEYNIIAQKLSLPATYLHTFSRRHAGALAISPYSNRMGQYVAPESPRRIGIVCQTPDFEYSFTSMALSYDPKKRSTVGILFLTAGRLTELLDLIRKLFIYSGSPLLVPSLIYYIFTYMQRRQLRDVNSIMIAVQKETGLLDRFLRSQSTLSSSPLWQRQAKYDELHGRLVEQHARLTIGLSEFTIELAQVLRNALDRLSDLHSQWKIAGLSCAKEADFREYVATLTRSTNSSVATHSRLLSRIDMQLRVLYNLMQQHTFEVSKRDTDVMKTIADAARRDSLEMKGIAILTMTFLPMTAFASIFSMNTFFAMGSNNNDIIVSSKFWIFWAVTIPVTVTILAGWSYWKEKFFAHMPGYGEEVVLKPKGIWTSAADIAASVARPGPPRRRKRKQEAPQPLSVLDQKPSPSIQMEALDESDMNVRAESRRYPVALPQPPTIPFDLVRRQQRVVSDLNAQIYLTP